MTEFAYSTFFKSQSFRVVNNLFPIRQQFLFFEPSKEAQKVQTTYLGK